MAAAPPPEDFDLPVAQLAPVLVPPEGRSSPFQFQNEAEAATWVERLRRLDDGIHKRTLLQLCAELLDYASRRGGRTQWLVDVAASRGATPEQLSDEAAAFLSDAEVHVRSVRDYVTYQFFAVLRKALTTGEASFHNALASFVAVNTERDAVWARLTPGETPYLPVFISPEYPRDIPAAPDLARPGVPALKYDRDYYLMPQDLISKRDIEQRKEQFDRDEAQRKAQAKKKLAELRATLSKEAAEERSRLETERLQLETERKRLSILAKSEANEDIARLRAEAADAKAKLETAAAEQTAALRKQKLENDSARQQELSKLKTDLARLKNEFGLSALQASLVNDYDTLVAELRSEFAAKQASEAAKANQATELARLREEMANARAQISGEAARLASQRVNDLAQYKQQLRQVAQVLGLQRTLASADFDFALLQSELQNDYARRVRETDLELQKARADAALAQQKAAENDSIKRELEAQKAKTAVDYSAFKAQLNKWKKLTTQQRTDDAEVLAKLQAIGRASQERSAWYNTQIAAAQDPNSVPKKTAEEKAAEIDRYTKLLARETDLQNGVAPALGDISEKNAPTFSAPTETDEQRENKESDINNWLAEQYALRRSVLRKAEDIQAQLVPEHERAKSYVELTRTRLDYQAQLDRLRAEASLKNTVFEAGKAAIKAQQASELAYLRASNKEDQVRAIQAVKDRAGYESRAKRSETREAQFVSRANEARPSNAPLGAFVDSLAARERTFRALAAELAAQVSGTAAAKWDAARLEDAKAAFESEDAFLEREAVTVEGDRARERQEREYARQIAKTRLDNRYKVEFLEKQKAALATQKASEIAYIKALQRIQSKIAATDAEKVAQYDGIIARSNQREIEFAGRVSRAERQAQELREQVDRIPDGSTEEQLDIRAKLLQQADNRAQYAGIYRSLTEREPRLRASAERTKRKKGTEGEDLSDEVVEANRLALLAENDSLEIESENLKQLDDNDRKIARFREKLSIGFARFLEEQREKRNDRDRRGAVRQAFRRPLNPADAGLLLGVDRARGREQVLPDEPGEAPRRPVAGDPLPREDDDEEERLIPRRLALLSEIAEEEGARAGAEWDSDLTDFILRRGTREEVAKMVEGLSRRALSHSLELSDESKRIYRQMVLLIGPADIAAYQSFAADRAAVAAGGPPRLPDPLPPLYVPFWLRLEPAAPAPSPLKPAPKRRQSEGGEEPPSPRAPKQKPTAEQQPRPMGIQIDPDSQAQVINALGGGVWDGSLPEEDIERLIQLNLQTRRIEAGEATQEPEQRSEGGNSAKRRVVKK